jgi:phage recombination protein Bet
MNEIATIEPRAKSVTAAMADKFGMDPGPFEQTLRATVFPSVGTREQFAAFLLVAKEYDLNPLTKEIYAFPGKGGGIVPVVSIDGWVTMINRHPKFDGMDFQDNLDSEDQLLSIECSIWRSDRSRPIVVTEYLSECYRATDAWKMKHRMLRHKALIQCARYAFGFSGIYDPDEGERIVEAQGGNGLPRLTMPSRRTPPAPPKRRAETVDPETGEIIEHEQDSPAPGAATEPAGGVPPGPAEASPQGPLEGAAVSPSSGAAVPSDPEAALEAGRKAEILATGNARTQGGTKAVTAYLLELQKDGEIDLISNIQRSAWHDAAKAADVERGRK